MITINRLLATVASLTMAVSAHSADITGAGATFPYPIYAKWAEAYKAKTGNGMNYQSIGSGGGIAQIKAKTVDFGASDMYLGELMEFGATDQIFLKPARKETEDYITGRFG